MWDTPVRVVKAGREPDKYNPRNGRVTLDPDKGATIQPDVYLCEVQPIELFEDDAAGTRVHTRTSWRIITRPGVQITTARASDGVQVDGIDGVLEIVGEIGQWTHPTHGHSELTVRRWEG